MAGFHDSPSPLPVLASRPVPDGLFGSRYFVYIDDWLKPYQDILPQQPAQKASYSEL